MNTRYFFQAFMCHVALCICGQNFCVGASYAAIKHTLCFALDRLTAPWRNPHIQHSMVIRDNMPTTGMLGFYHRWLTPYLSGGGKTAVLRCVVAACVLEWAFKHAYIRVAGCSRALVAHELTTPLINYISNMYQLQSAYEHNTNLLQRLNHLVNESYLDEAASQFKVCSSEGYDTVEDYQTFQGLLRKNKVPGCTAEVFILNARFPTDSRNEQAFYHVKVYLRWCKEIMRNCESSSTVAHKKIDAILKNIVLTYDELSERFSLPPNFRPPNFRPHVKTKFCAKYCNKIESQYSELYDELTRWGFTGKYEQYKPKFEEIRNCVHSREINAEEEYDEWSDSEDEDS